MRDEVNVQPVMEHRRGYTVDFADAIDTPAEILAEELGITPAQAARVLEWQAQHAAAATTEPAGDKLREIIALIMPGQRGGAVEARVGGLIAASGMLGRTNLDSMAAIAVHLEQRFRCAACGSGNVRRITRAAISHWATIAADRLGLSNFRHCRDTEAREHSRAARTRNL